ncbi:MAG: Crp/Fnr family transcriptional regulator [Bacteroidetes bacterium]|nr:Crp/Fnr family transcriptional regulator [Bacteroidota bacterium]
MEKLLHFLEGISPLETELKDFLTERLRTKVFPAKSYLLKAGHISRHIYFIEKGLVRCYYMLGARDISSWFMREGDVVVSVNSFFAQMVSVENIQAMEDCEVHYISYEELEETYKTFVGFNIHGRKILTHYYCLSEQRAASMRSMKAHERYTWLQQNEPWLLGRVPRKYLSSYLGVTEATMTNTRYALAKGKINQPINHPL